VFKLLSENGCLSLYCGKKPLFGNLTARLNTQDGVQPHFDTFEVSTAEGLYDEITSEDKISKCKLKATYGESTVAVIVETALKPRKPQFRSKQVYFDPELAVNLVLQVNTQDRYMALYQHKPWWLRPAFFQGL
jgi:hypothetical protein